MGDKISGLTAAGSVTDTDQFEINQSGVSKRVTAAQVATYVGAGGGGGAVGLVARATCSAGTLTGDGTTSRINFNTKDYDPGTAITTGTAWAFSAPGSAWYDVHVTKAFVNSDGHMWVIGAGCRIDAYVNGGPIATIGLQELMGTASGIAINISGMCAVNMDTGDDLDLRFVNSSGDNRELESDVSVEIYRVT